MTAMIRPAPPLIGTSGKSRFNEVKKIKIITSAYFPFFRKTPPAVWQPETYEI